MQEHLEIIKYKIKFTLEDIENIYHELKQEEIKFLEIAKRLELTYSASSVEDTDINSIINQIKSNIQRINEQMQEGNLENIDKANSILQELEKIKQDTTIKTDYIKELKETLIKSLDRRIQKLITDSRILKLEEEKKQVENKKISLIGKLTGKGKLKQARLDNIDLKMQTLMLAEQSDKTEVSLEDSLSDLYAYTKYDLENKLTLEIEQFLEILETDSELKEMINQQNLETQTDKKISERQSPGYLIPVGEKSKRSSNREQIDILQMQNSEMNRQILNSRARTITRQNSLSELSPQDKILSKFQIMLNEVNLSTKTEQQPIIEQEQG